MLISLIYPVAGPATGQLWSAFATGKNNTERRRVIDQDAAGLEPASRAAWYSTLVRQYNLRTTRTGAALSFELRVVVRPTPLLEQVLMVVQS